MTNATTMRSSLTILFIFAACTLLWTQARGQSLTVDLGNDTSFCADFESADSVLLGASLNVQGGQLPYSYRWFGKFIYDAGFYELNAGSVFDTTAANPTLYVPDHELDSAMLFLEVTDINGLQAVDSIFLRFCTYGPIPLGNTVICPVVGDTIEMYANPASSCGIDSVSWFPENLFVEQIDNYRARFVVDEEFMDHIPNAVFHMNTGCDMDMGYSDPLVICVQPLGVTETEIDSDFDVFPNPSNGSFTITDIDPGSELSIYNASGSLILSRNVNDASIIVDKDLSPGIYFIQLSLNGEAKTTKLVVTP